MSERSHQPDELELSEDLIGQRVYFRDIRDATADDWRVILSNYKPWASALASRILDHLSCSTALRATHDARNGRVIRVRRPAKRSVCTWCLEPVSQLDPRPHEHPALSPGASRP